MYLNRLLKKQLILTIVSILLIGLFVFGTSFALFQVSSSSEEEQTISVGDLDVTFSGGSEISINNIEPQTDAEGLTNPDYTYTFTVTNSGTIAYNYDIKLVNYDNNEENLLNHNYIRYSINGSNPATLGEQTGGKIANGSLNPLKSKEYTLKIWVADAEEYNLPNSALNSKIHLKIVIDMTASDPFPEKGTLITMDVGDGLPDTYRVLKVDGSEALVLAMQDYNVGTTYKYNATSKTTSFNGTEGQQYAGSDLDILLNTTMYGEMNSTAKSAIVAKDIDQNMFSYSYEPNELEESEPYTSDYQHQYNWDDDNWKNSNLVGTVNVGSRYVYALDEVDIYEYIGKRYISSSELNEMFFNQNTAYATNSTMGYYKIWLRSANSFDSSSVWYVNGRSGALDYSSVSGARAAFVIDLSKIDWEYDMPNKGQLITMDVGDGLPDTYRVLKLDGTEALVLAMQDYNVGTTYPYNATSKTTTFGSYTGQQYAGSDLDILLNTTMYGEMNSTAKSAIVAKNINQNMFSYSDPPNELEESEPYTYEYQSQYNWDNNDWDNSNLVGTVNVGSRYVYALDVADIYEYIGRRYISSSELNEMFFNQNTAYSGNSTMGYQRIWLRSASDSSRAWCVNGGYGDFYVFNFYSSFGTRAAFVIDLSKIEYEEV